MELKESERYESEDGLAAWRARCGTSLDQLQHAAALRWISCSVASESDAPPKDYNMVVGGGVMGVVCRGKGVLEGIFVAQMSLLRFAIRLFLVPWFPISSKERENYLRKTEVS